MGCGCLAFLLCACLFAGWWMGGTTEVPTPTPKPTTKRHQSDPFENPSVPPPVPPKQPQEDPFASQQNPDADPFAGSRQPSKPLKLPGPDKLAADLPPDLANLKAIARSSGGAYDWRQVADLAAKKGYYALASEAYRNEAKVYQRTGDLQAARAEEMKAGQYATEIELYVERPSAQGPKQPPRARLEPAHGCYVGAFIDRDDNLPSDVLENQRHGDIATFNELTGKKHASFFMYRSYGVPFPRQWAEQVKAQGAIPQIAWEPGDLSEVQYDGYLQSFVSDAAALDWPVFIRFAGEMNGEWTRYHADPKEYRRAFRTVYQAFRVAPKAALIWCPNSVPVTGLEQYYPGDDAVDWVGVNLYSVMFLDNDPARPGDKLNPIDLLDPIYRRYASRKPIAIGEFAASHQSALSPEPRPDFAQDKLRQLYESLPTRYPRVKLISWYDCNNLVHAKAGRQLNNYLLTEPKEVLETYRGIVKSPYFLAAGKTDAPVIDVPLAQGGGLKPGQGVVVWARSYEPRPRVFLRVDGKLVSDRTRWAVSGLEPGKHKLEVLVYDGKNRLAGRLERQAIVAR